MIIDNLIIIYMIYTKAQKNFIFKETVFMVDGDFNFV